MSTAYYTVKHAGCSIYPTSMGGDSYVSLPIEVHFSNSTTEGYTASLEESTFEFKSTSIPDTFSLDNGKRAERKLLRTYAQWTTGSGDTSVTHTALLGTRVEDSSIEFNQDTETTTDILGITYTDINKTEPQQDFDPLYLIGGTNGTADLIQYLTKAALKNDIQAYNQKFDIFVTAAFITSTVQD